MDDHNNQASSLNKSFDPQSLEERWYEFWEDSGCFGNTPKEEKAHGSVDSFCIQLPPPNVTGTLHMGHAFQQTLMDSMIRYQRMLGKDANWIVGTDHAGIATQLVVERQLEEKGLTREGIGRERFLNEAWLWKRQSGSTIIQQMRRLGASANWRYADTEGYQAGYFTMDERMSKAVIEVFVRLYEQGLIYRGNRLVNWDPKLQTAVSDLEVDNFDSDGKIWEIEYTAVDTDTSVVVATTRPETLLGDVAVAIHPDDKRYKNLIGKHVHVPLCDRKIPIIGDEYVDSTFGTGCVKITPAHDFNDFSIGQRHGLTPINILNLDGTINNQAPEKYRGMDRFAARTSILEDLKNLGSLVSEKPHKLSVPKSDRTGEIVEPMLTDQWFVKTDGMAKTALSAVEDKKIQFHPAHWTSTYNHWLENIQDWCISRQLWWGHQIPAWYDEDGNIYVAENQEKAEEQAKKNGQTARLTRDADVLDTWFSSALVPFTSLGWPDKKDDLKRYLPSDVLVTGFDIIFFWVARMIMMTTHFIGEVPFKHVYINALVRDSDGQKMSKSKGNTIDPIDLLDGIDLDTLIAKSTKGLLLKDHRLKVENYLKKNYPKGIPSYGADAVRFTFSSLATFSRTLNFDLSRCEGYRNFCNKLWNASRFVLMHTEEFDCGLESHGTQACITGEYLDFSPADKWIKNELDRTITKVTRSFEEYRFDNVASSIYQFVWDEFCDWYLEIAKVQIQHGNEPQRRATRRTLIRTLEKTLRLAHPIIPFITEEVWQKVAPIADAKLTKSIMLASYPSGGALKLDTESDEIVSQLKQIVSECRSLKSALGIGPSERWPLYVSGNKGFLTAWRFVICSLTKTSEVIVCDSLPEIPHAPIAACGDFKLLIKVQVDPTLEREKLLKKQISLNNVIESDRQKLNNKNFTDRAPQTVVQQTRDRLQDHERQIKEIDKQLEALGLETD